MQDMFKDATSFNGDISTWDVRQVTSTASMFSNAISFRGDLASWQLESAEMMTGMFSGALQYSQMLCWNAIDVYNVVDNADMFCGTDGAALDSCCVDSYLVQESCCSLTGDSCPSVCLDLSLGAGDPTMGFEVGGEIDLTENQEEGDEGGGVLVAGGENADIEEDEIGEWEGLVSMTQVSPTPTHPIVVPERDVAVPEGTDEADQTTTTTPTAEPITAAPTITRTTLSPTLAPVTASPTDAPTTARQTASPVETKTQHPTITVTSQPTPGETSEPTTLTDDFFLDRPDTDDNFLTPDEVVEQQPTVSKPSGESDYVDGENIATAIEEMDEERRVADSGVIIFTSTFIVVIFIMLIAFTMGSWYMQRTSFGGMPPELTEDDMILK